MSVVRAEFSAGGVVYKKNGSAVKVVLIARRGKTVWCLPKGKIEKAETPELAAAREIKEETGLTAELEKALSEIAYRYISPVDKAQVFKKVRFFLFKYLNGSVQDHDDEVDEARWFDISEALKVMTYPSEKNIMKKASVEVCK